MNTLARIRQQPAFLVTAAGILGTTGLALGNGWITGAMLVMLLIVAAPCLVMCALGLCMEGGSEGGSCKRGGSNAPVEVGRPGDVDPR